MKTDLSNKIIYILNTVVIVLLLFYIPTGLYWNYRHPISISYFETKAEANEQISRQKDTNTKLMEIQDGGKYKFYVSRYR